MPMAIPSCSSSTISTSSWVSPSASSSSTTACRSQRVFPRKYGTTNGSLRHILDANQPLLEFRDVDTFYGSLHILKDVSYSVGTGEIVALLGSNGAGKTTTMKTILGIVRPRDGQVLFAGSRIDGRITREIVEQGIAPVPEG